MHLRIPKPQTFEYLEFTMYTSQRPEAVIKAIHDKFERVAFHEKNTEYGHGQLEENGGRSP